MKPIRKNLKEYQYITIWTEDDDDILLSIYRQSNLKMDIDVARSLIESRLDYSLGKPIYTLIDVTNVKSTTKEARDYMNSPDGGLRGILAGAFLSNNVVATLVINLFLKVNPPPIPAKFFTNKEEALKWLKRIKGEKENALLELN